MAECNADNEEEMHRPRINLIRLFGVLERAPGLWNALSRLIVVIPGENKADELASFTVLTRRVVIVCGKNHSRSPSAGQIAHI